MTSTRVPPAPDAARVASAYDSIAGTYDASYRATWDVAEDDFTRDALIRVGAAAVPGRVLDIGCGTGHLLDLLHVYPRDAYVGVDVSRAMLERAAVKHKGYAFMLADMGRMESWHGLHLQGFSTVTALHSLPYFDVPNLLMEARGILPPGGRFFGIGYGSAWFRQRDGKGSAAVTKTVARAAVADVWARAALGLGYRDVAVYGIGRHSRNPFMRPWCRKLMDRESRNGTPAVVDDSWHVVLEAVA